MARLIELLTDRAPTRRDGREFLTIRRPVPQRPRHLFEVIAELGDKANSELLMATFLWKRETDPRDVVYAVLGRMPYLKELEALPAEYSPRDHMRALLKSPEFRLRIVRRVLDAYPERQRLMLVRVPRCGGEALQALLAVDNPLISMRLADPAEITDDELVPELGRLLGRVRDLPTVLLADRLPLRTFLHSPMQKNDARGGALRSWEFDSAVYRRNDKLFTVLREPEDILLSQVNASLREREVGGRRPQPGSAVILEEAGKVLEGLATNPICRALGEGTARTALLQVRLCNLEIADFSQYARWIKEIFQLEMPPHRPEPPLFGREHLTETQREALQAKTSEDRVVYDRFRKVIDATGAMSAYGATI